MRLLCRFIYKTLPFWILDVFLVYCDHFYLWSGYSIGVVCAHGVGTASVRFRLPRLRVEENCFDDTSKQTKNRETGMPVSLFFVTPIPQMPGDLRVRRSAQETTPLPKAPRA